MWMWFFPVCTSDCGRLFLEHLHIGKLEKELRGEWHALDHNKWDNRKRCTWEEVGVDTLRLQVLIVAIKNCLASVVAARSCALHCKEDHEGIAAQALRETVCAVYLWHSQGGTALQGALVEMEAIVQERLRRAKCCA